MIGVILFLELVMKVLSLCLALILLTLASNPSSLAMSSRQNVNQTNTKIYEPKEVDRKARVTKRSEPQYTEQARRNHRSGFVVLLVVLKGSGEIGNGTSSVGVTRRTSACSRLGVSGRPVQVTSNNWKARR